VRKGFLLLGALVLTSSLGLVACGGGSEPKPTPTAPKAAATATSTTPKPAATTPVGGGATVAVTMTENPYAYAPTTFNFTSGKTYTLDIQAPKEFHTFSVEELGINIFINQGQAVKQDVTPTKVGTFTLKCLPHESLGMKGTVVVS